MAALFFWKIKCFYYFQWAFYKLHVFYDSPCIINLVNVLNILCIVFYNQSFFSYLQSFGYILIRTKAAKFKFSAIIYVAKNNCAKFEFGCMMQFFILTFIASLIYCDFKSLFIQIFSLERWRKLLMSASISNADNLFNICFSKRVYSYCYNSWRNININYLMCEIILM